MTNDYWLCVNVMAARSLPPSDLDGWSDPYAVVKLNKKKIGKTKVEKKTLNPVWNHIFRIKKVKLDQELKVKLYDKDQLSSDKIGGVKIKLSSIEPEKWSSLWYRLKDMKNYDDNVRGYVNLSIQITKSPYNCFNEKDHNYEPEINAKKEREENKKALYERKLAFLEHHKEMQKKAKEHYENYAKNQLAKMEKN